MVELLVVIAILGVLTALLVPGLGKAKEVAEAAKNMVNLREITLSTINWAADNGNKLPSPQYPGGMYPNAQLPQHWDAGTSGLWLDGVVFGAIYMRENSQGQATSYTIDDKGSHLRGTLFENTQSVKKDPSEEDWHKHSYAMNSNLAYDGIYDQVEGGGDPYLTEKALSNIIFMPKAMIYIENEETNIVDHSDRQAIIDTMEKRWNGTKVIATFLDGHADRLSENQIPEDDPENDRESSRFWRGIDPDR